MASLQELNLAHRTLGDFLNANQEKLDYESFSAIFNQMLKLAGEIIEQTEVGN